MCGEWTTAGGPEGAPLLVSRHGYVDHARLISELIV
jgi:hypothetical protein